jgi:threonine/homoserine efflux transporter RhtA
MQGFKDLFASERGIFAIILSLSSTVLAILGKLAITEWISFNQWIGTVLILSKTVTTALETFKKPSPPVPTPAVATEKSPTGT